MSCVHEQLIDALLDHLMYLQVAHHVPGRIRIKASWSAAPKLAGVHEADLARIIAGVPGILDYRINRKALSLVIRYDPNTLAPALWEEIALLGCDPSRREEIRERLLGVARQKGGGVGVGRTG